MYFLIGFPGSPEVVNTVHDARRKAGRAAVSVHAELLPPPVTRAEVRPGKGHMGNSWRACANQGQPLHPLPCWHSKPSCHCIASHLGGCQHTACLFWSFREWLSNLLKMQIRSGHSPAYNPPRTSCGLRLQCQLSCRLESLNSPLNPASVQPLPCVSLLSGF